LIQSALIEKVRREGVDVSIPSNSISRELAYKIRNQYFPPKTTLRKRKSKFLHKQVNEQIPVEVTSGGTTGRLQIGTIQFKGPLPRSKAPPFKLVYTPATPPAPLPRRLKRQREKRTCPMCAAKFPTKSEIRTHYVIDHMEEIIDGKFVCKVKVAELSHALDATVRQIANIAERIGIKIKGSTYIPARMVKKLASRVRTTIASEASVKPSPCLKTLVLTAKPKTLTKTDYRQHAVPNLRSEILDDLQRKDFGELRGLIDACLKGRRVSREDQRLLTMEPGTLREYARILESKMSGSPLSQKIVKRIFEDIEIHEKKSPRLAAIKLKWKILPEGENIFQRTTEDLGQLAKRAGPAVYDVSRLNKIASLRPNEKYQGTDGFDGYIIFEYQQHETAVFECAVIGNAIYVLGKNWKTLSRLTKSQLRDDRRRDVDRIIHRGDWFSHLKSLLEKRRHEAALR
jgi:hypothetical protein